MRLVLDTSALWYRPLCDALTQAHAAGWNEFDHCEVVLPAVAYAERSRQVRGDPRRTAAFQRLLELAGIRVEPFGRDEADNLSEQASEPSLWREHSRDMLIACHVRDERLLVTSDGGVAFDAARTVDPEDATRLIEALVGPEGVDD